LYKRQILAGHAENLEISNKLYQVSEKYHDIAILEASISELHDMFLNFALLTEHQGEVLDQIEFNLRQANDAVENGNESVHKSIGFHKNIRKKKCRLVGIVAILLAVILVVIL
jgi:t-SNARE complex subunit (syntaxin)